MGPMKPNHYVAADSYHRYKEDVAMAAKLKVRAVQSSKFAVTVQKITEVYP